MKLLGIFNLWDDVPFTEQTAEDLMWFFKVNVVVSYGYILRGLFKQPLRSGIKGALLS
jgi:hypothetical protein